jgi:UDP-N-acetylmuramyl pentapeptide phosphotransferase/UDP-N-acetylglucosamine-1-phosphate transferase
MTETARLLLVLAPAAGVAALLAAGSIVVFRSRLDSYALARPNERSSHSQPTPQWGGFPVVAATLIAAWGAIAWTPGVLQGWSIPLLTLTAAAALLAVVGAIDDLRNLPAAPRLLLQCVAVGMVIAALPAEWRVFSFLPWWSERAALALGLLWFVNLVNFMDGIDWMTVAEFVPLTGAIAVLGAFAFIAPLPALVAAALFGAILGFARFNQPVARLFLGDMGSLPIGLLAGWLLLQVAAEGHVVAAMLLPLYYVADATLTLLRRLLAGEPVWQAHRTHFYQRAVKAGYSVSDVVTRVFAVNLVLAALAILTCLKPGLITGLTALAVGATLVGWLLVSFTRGKRQGYADIA